jgi:hypothetical protein
MKINFLPMLQMGYETIYGCAADSDAVHICHDCPEGIDAESAGTRRGGFIKKDYLATIAADPLAVAGWTAGIAGGNITILPELRGAFDPGDPKELKGFGDRKVTYGPRDMKWTFDDPVYYENYAFYNEISRRKNEVPFFVTSSVLHLFDTVGSMKAKNPITENLDDEVTWNVEVLVSSKNLPTLHKISDEVGALLGCDQY